MNDNLSRAGKTLLIMAVVVLSITYVHGLHSPPAGQTSAAQAELPQSPADDFEDLLNSIEYVESRGNINAIGDNGKAIGAYQIWKIYVDDVNRIEKIKHTSKYSSPFQYGYQHRKNPYLSRYMVKTYLEHYATEKRIGKKPTFEDMARIHNGGPNGWKKESTKPYWAKVKARLEE